MASNKQLATKWLSQLIVRENPVLCNISEWSDNQATNIASFYQPLVVIFYHNLSSTMNQSFGQLTTFSILLKEIVENQIRTNFIHISMVLKSFLLTKWLICDETKSPFIFLLIEEYAKMEQAGDKWPYHDIQLNFYGLQKNRQTKQCFRKCTCYFETTFFPPTLHIQCIPNSCPIQYCVVLHFLGFRQLSRT